MKKFKKAMALSLALAMGLSLVACGDKKEETTTEALESDGSLMLLGFGTFSAWEQTERIGRNPRNGVAYMIRARRSVKFKPGKLLLKRLNASLSK